jgi:DNA repair protein RadC
MAAQPDDKALTDRMIQVGNIVGINVYDHVIINAKTEDYLSFADVGLMEELRKSTAWIPKFQQVKQIRAMAKAEGAKQRDKEIARTMKKNKVSADLISKFTGLSLEEIKSLK